MRVVALGSLVALLAVFTLTILGESSANDQPTAQRAVLKIRDMPPGWRKSAPDDSSAADHAYGRVGECRDFAKAAERARALPRAEANFKKRDAEASNSASIYPTTAAAERAFTILQAPDVPMCIEKAFKLVAARNLERHRQTRAHIDALTADVVQLPITPAGDDRIGFEATVRATVQGFSLDFYADLEFLRVGRALTNFSFFDSSPQTGADDFVRTVVDRLASV